PAWIVNPWNGIDLDILEYQWSVAVPFWKEIDALARQHDVQIAFEMHPRNLVFSPPTFEQFLEKVEPTNIGVNLDPSHLFWQQMEPIDCIERLGRHITHVHAKDTAVLPGATVRGVLDTVFDPVPEDPAQRTPTGIGHHVSTWPEDAAWRFVALGEGHGVDYWIRFLSALAAVNPDLHVNIEHEDAAFGQIEGLERSARTLLAAAEQAGGRARAAPAPLSAPALPPDPVPAPIRPAPAPAGVRPPPPACRARPARMPGTHRPHDGHLSPACRAPSQTRNRPCHSSASPSTTCAPRPRPRSSPTSSRT